MRPGSPIWHFHPPSAPFRGPIGGSTRGPSATIRTRPGNVIWHFHPRIAAFRGPIRGLHRRPQWDRPHASRKPSLAFSLTQ
eukprot:1248451-Pyramimonas_sp.AAC.1